MEPIQVVLLDLPRMLNEIVVGHLVGEDRVRVRIGMGESEPVDVVILGSEGDELPERGRRLLRSHPDAKVLTVRRDGKETFLHELRPVRIELGQMSKLALLAAITSMSCDLL